MSNNCCDTVRTFIVKEQLLDAGGLHLVAVSGGADSVCLLLMLLQLGYRVEAVHCNFKLRGNESDRDEQFVRELCLKNEVKLHVAHFDTITYTSVHKVSIEMAARQLRYTYFEQLRSDLGACSICVGHHKDDSVETILMNLLRGTGIQGLTGIKPRNAYVVRPLLCLSRNEILQWLEQQQQPYIEDSSNMVADILRNKLRLNVIPLLTDIMPAAKGSILSTARHLHETEKVYRQAIQQTLGELVSANSIDIAALTGQPSPEALLYHWLSPFGFSAATIEDISHRLTVAQGGRSWKSATHLLSIHRQQLVVTPIPRQRPVMLLPEPATYVYDDGTDHFSISEKDGQHIIHDSQVACLDAERVTFPLKLRPVKEGDRFQPFGMKGTKLVSDFLADMKIAPAERRRQIVVCDCNDNILWLTGLRPDGRFTIGNYTHKTLIIKHSTNNQSTTT